MPDKPGIPEGFSVGMWIPPDGKRVSAAEVEADLLSKKQKLEEVLRSIIYDLAVLYSRTGRLAQSFDHFQHLLQITAEPGEKAHYCLSLGQLMERMNDFPSAIEFYRKAFTLEPTDTQDWYLIHNNLGYSLNMLGRYSEAERYCRKAIEINPKRYNAYKNLGISMEGQGCLAEAASFYIQATKANASDPRAADHLENLLSSHPDLLNENPALVEEMEKCRQATDFAQKMIQTMLERYYHSSKS